MFYSQSRMLKISAKALFIIKLQRAPRYLDRTKVLFIFFNRIKLLSVIQILNISWHWIAVQNLSLTFLCIYKICFCLK